jgi:hypothetical protein
LAANLQFAATIRKVDMVEGRFEVKLPTIYDKMDRCKAEKKRREERCKKQEARSKKQEARSKKQEARRKKKKEKVSEKRWSRCAKR